MTQWYSTREVADRYSVTERAVRMWIDQGHLPGAIKSGPSAKSDWRIPDTALAHLDSMIAEVSRTSKS